MMGRQVERAQLFYEFSLERHVPSDHLLRRLDAALNLSCPRADPDGYREAVFRDDGYSGSSPRRPGLDRLRDLFQAGRVDRVPVTAPDRLARNYVQQVLLAEELPDRMGRRSTSSTAP